MRNAPDFSVEPFDGQDPEGLANYVEIPEATASVNRQLEVSEQAFRARLSPAQIQALDRHKERQQLYRGRPIGEAPAAGPGFLDVNPVPDGKGE